MRAHLSLLFKQVTFSLVSCWVEGGRDVASQPAPQECHISTSLSYLCPSLQCVLLSVGRHYLGMLHITGILCLLTELILV